MNTLDSWGQAAAAALGLPEPTAADRDLILDVAREAAHGVVRPGAPIASYLLGVAVGRGVEPGVAADALIALARAWPESGPPQPPGSSSAP